MPDPRRSFWTWLALLAVFPVPLEPGLWLQIGWLTQLGFIVLFGFILRITGYEL
jgi:hypothetical protein